MTGYPGSKAASGVCERIIRQMPPHKTYVEAFAGYAAVFRRKLGAQEQLLIDANPIVCDHLQYYLAVTGERARVVCEDALAFLPAQPWLNDPSTLVFVDAPYLASVRTRLLYDVEFETPESHAALLKFIRSLTCLVMITHYDCAQYRKALRKWRLIKIPAMTRGGLRTECLWCNFAEPGVLHDPRFAGGDFRERERIKRKQARWTAKFATMHPRERQAIAAALVKVDRTAVDAAMRTVPPSPAMTAGNVESYGAEECFPFPK
jgi:16S rRNA G966 N2-methylase RsmD